MGGLFGGGRAKRQDNSGQMMQMQMQAAQDARNQQMLEAQRQQAAKDAEAARAQMEAEKQRQLEESKKSTGAFLGAGAGATVLGNDTSLRDTFLRS